MAGRAGRRFILRPTRLRYVRLPAAVLPPQIEPNSIASTSVVFSPADPIFPTAVPTTTEVFEPTLSTTPDVYPPGPVTSFSARALGTNSIQLTWTAPTDFDYGHVEFMRTKTLPYGELDWGVGGDVQRIVGPAPEIHDGTAFDKPKVVTSGTYSDVQDIDGQPNNSPRGTKSSYYLYIPATSGTVTLDTFGNLDPDFNTYLYVMDANGTIIAENDDDGGVHGGDPFNSWLQFSAVANHAYIIAPAGYDLTGASIGDMYFNLSGPAPTGETGVYAEYDLEPGITYYYKMFAFDSAGNVDADTGVTDSATTMLPDEGQPFEVVVTMPAGDFDILPGTPIPAPTPSTVDIEYTAVEFDLRVEMLDGAVWVKDLLQLPPVRPGTVPPTPGTSFDPAFVRTPTDITVEIWDQTNTILIDTLDYSASRQFLDEYNGVGSGTLKVPATHESALLFKRDRVLRFYYKDIPDSVFASIIEQRKNGVIAEAGSQWSEVSGRGTLAWLEDAVVLPFVPPEVPILQFAGYSILPGENFPRTPVYASTTNPMYIAPNSPDVRAFNFGSRDAFDHELLDDTGPGSPSNHGAGWFRPEGYPQNNTAETNKKRYKPDQWPDPVANWIWGANPLLNRPVYELCWFRARVFIPATGTYRMFVTGDNAFVAWVDGIEVASSGLEDAYTAGWKVSSEVDVDFEGGWHVLAVRGQNQFKGTVEDPIGTPAGVIVTLMTLDKNSKPKDPVPVARTGYVGRLPDSGWWCNWKGPAWKAGDVLFTLVNEAKARGVTRLQNVEMDFDAATDSHGQPWKTRVSRTWDVGTSLLSVAFDLCELGVDVWMTADNVLHCAERRGSDTPTFSVTYGENVSGYDTEETFGGASVAYTRTRSGWLRLSDERSQMILGGVRETGISVANTDSEDQAIGISHRAIGAVVMSSILATAESIVPIPGSIPYTDVEISDIIYVLSPNGRQRMGRLLSVAMSENEAGSTLWAPEIEIWSSPFGDGVDPDAPQDPVNPDDPFDSSTWVPAAYDWFRFIPGGEDYDNPSYPKAVTTPGGDGGGDGDSTPAGTPRSRGRKRSPRPPYNSRNDRTPPNAERIAIQPDPPLTTAGYLLWVDTGGL